MTIAFFATGQIETLFNLFVIFAAAKLAAELCERLRQPVVVGEILAGVLIGPGGLGIVQPSEVTQALAEIGVILLLFTVGLEISPRRLLDVGRTAVVVAIGGVILPFAAGYALLRFYGEANPQALFFGAALVATSVGITARVLGSMGVILAKTSQIILGAAVIDDILGLIVLSVVSSLSSGTIRYAELTVTVLLPVAFTVFMLTFGTKIVHRTRPAIERLRVGQSFFVAGMLLCFGLSWLSAVIGVAAIIGAFLAGIALSEATEDTDLMKQAAAVTEVAVPFFMVGIGMQLNVALFQDVNLIGLAVVGTLVAVATKLIGCGAGARKLGARAALQVGMGMAPRGEVGIIIAQVGKKFDVFSDSLFGVAVFIAVATTLIAPPFLRILFRKPQHADDPPTQSFPRIG